MPESAKPLAYPGVRGDFQKIEHYYRSSNNSLIEYVTFVNQPDVYQIFGEFNKNSTHKELKNFYYFIAANGGLGFDCEKMSYHFDLHEPAHMKKFFELFLAHNDFPDGAAQSILQIMSETTESRMLSFRARKATTGSTTLSEVCYMEQDCTSFCKRDVAGVDLMSCAPDPIFVSHPETALPSF